MNFTDKYKNSIESKRLIKYPESFTYNKLFKLVTFQLNQKRKNAEDHEDKSKTLPQYHGYKFEWDMWNFFYELKPDLICDPDFEEPFRFDLSAYKKTASLKDLDWPLISKSNSKQMDVVAIYDKHIFIIECKHTEENKSASYLMDDIEDFVIRQNFIKKRVTEIFGDDYIPVFILCTSNYCLDDAEQLSSLENNEIIILSEKEREYISVVLKGERDKKTLKYKGGSGSPEFALSQFLGFFRGNQPDFNDAPRRETKWKIPAFHSLSGAGKKHKVFTFSISPSKMLKVSTVAHQRLKNAFEVTNTSNSYYQRILSKKRLDALGKHLIDTKLPFPNNILVSYRGKNIGWEPSDPDEDINAGNIPGKIEFDACPGTFHVIDGQHRLFGYTATPKNQGIRDSHRLIVTAFVGLSVQEEADIFLDVNSNAKPIPPDLLMEIEWASGVESQSNIANGIVFELRDNENSCLRELILEAESKARGKLNPKNIRTALTSLKILPKNYENSIFWDGDIFSTKDKTFNFINESLGEFKKSNLDRWKKKNGVIQDIFMQGMLKVIDRIAILENGNLKKTKEYMDHLGKQFSNETEKRKSQILNMKGFFTLGGAAPGYVASFLVDKYLKDKNMKLVERTDEGNLIFIDKENAPAELRKAAQIIDRLQRKIIKYESGDFERNKENKSINERATEYCGLMKNIVHEVLARDEHYTLEFWDWLIMPAFWERDNVWDRINLRHLNEKKQSGGNSYDLAFNHVEGQPLRLLLSKFKNYEKAKPRESDDSFSKEERKNNTLKYIWEKLLIPPPNEKFSSKIDFNQGKWTSGTEYLEVFEKCRNYGTEKIGSAHAKLKREKGDPSFVEKRLFEEYYEEQFKILLRKVREDIEILQDEIDEVLD